MPTQNLVWNPDELGAGFEYTHFPIAEKNNSSRATLVRYIPAADPEAWELRTPSNRFNFLFIHGWNDYFFHKEFARFIASIGGNFYACDLRRFGRSHKNGEIWGYIDNLHSYEKEINFARAYAESQKSAPFILYGHSTGGLVTALWNAQHQAECAGLILNSPWLELQYPSIIRKMTTPLLSMAAKYLPYKTIPGGAAGFYYRGKTGGNLASGPFPEEEKPQLDPFFTQGWKPNPKYWHLPTFPVRFGWLNAIFAGQTEVEKGLDITTPILLLTSAASSSSAVWDKRILGTDVVLSVTQIWKRATDLGSDITLKKLNGAVHDVVLSRASVRRRCYRSINNWIDNLLSAS